MVGGLMSKRIHIYYINKIKTCKLKIFEEEDDDYPNRKVVSANEKAIEHYLDKAGISEENLRIELLKNIRWTNDNCVDTLAKLGWTIEYGNFKQRGEIK